VKFRESEFSIEKVSSPSSIKMVPPSELTDINALSMNELKYQAPVQNGKCQLFSLDKPIYFALKGYKTSGFNNFAFPIQMYRNKEFPSLDEVSIELSLQRMLAAAIKHYCDHDKSISPITFESNTPFIHAIGQPPVLPLNENHGKAMFFDPEGRVRDIPRYACTVDVVIRFSGFVVKRRVPHLDLKVYEAVIYPAVEFKRLLEQDQSIDSNPAVPTEIVRQVGLESLEQPELKRQMAGDRSHESAVALLEKSVLLSEDPSEAHGGGSRPDSSPEIYTPVGRLQEEDIPLLQQTLYEPSEGVFSRSGSPCS